MSQTANNVRLKDILTTFEGLVLYLVRMFKVEIAAYLHDNEPGVSFDTVMQLIKATHFSTSEDTFKLIMAIEDERKRFEQSVGMSINELLNMPISSIVDNIDEYYSLMITILNLDSMRDVISTYIPKDRLITALSGKSKNKVRIGDSEYDEKSVVLMILELSELLYSIV